VGPGRILGTTVAAMQRIAGLRLTTSHFSQSAAMQRIAGLRLTTSHFSVPSRGAPRCTRDQPLRSNQTPNASPGSASLRHTFPSQAGTIYDAQQFVMSPTAGCTDRHAHRACNYLCAAQYKTASVRRSPAMRCIAANCNPPPLAQTDVHTEPVTPMRCAVQNCFRQAEPGDALHRG
jgi:hypothetical protein